MKILNKILAAILGLFLAAYFIKGVEITVIPGKSTYFGINFTRNWQMIIFLGIILGLINSILRPILNLISFPLRIITLGLSFILLNLAILFGLDLFFPELKFGGFFPLLFTALLILILEFIFK